MGGDVHGVVSVVFAAARWPVGAGEGADVGGWAVGGAVDAGVVVIETRLGAALELVDTYEALGLIEPVDRHGIVNQYLNLANDIDNGVFDRERVGTALSLFKRIETELHERVTAGRGEEVVVLGLDDLLAPVGDPPN